MPTEEQREAVREQIERLTQALFLQDGETVIPDAPGSAVLGLTWAELIAHHKIEMMATRVDWLGFDAEQEWDVVQNVLDGKDRFHWMDGIATDRAPEPPSNSRPGHGRPSATTICPTRSEPWRTNTTARCQPGRPRRTRRSPTTTG